MHGARKRETIKQGADHPQYRHGKRTKAYEEESSRTIARLQALEKIGFEAKILIGKKQRGPKSKYFYTALNQILEDINNMPPELTRTPFS